MTLCLRLGEANEDSEYVSQDEMWVEVVNILYKNGAAGDCDVQSGWSLDRISGLLAFIGCIKGCKASKYAEALINWVQSRQVSDDLVEDHSEITAVNTSVGQT